MILKKTYSSEGNLNAINWAIEIVTIHIVFIFDLWQQT